MKEAVDGSAVLKLRGMAEREFGLRFGEDQQEFLVEVLRQRLQASRISSAAEYFHLLSPSPQGREELRQLAAALTIPETYFFRGRDQLHAFECGVIPERVRRRAATRELKILSAGCATGEEPYTLAIILRDSFPELQSWNVTLLGVDLNPHLLRHASLARYSPWSLRETSAEERARCFEQDGTEFVVREPYRRMVTFREVNLSQLPADLFAAGSFDVVFCRNVIMYLAPDALRGVIERFGLSLAPGGYLFLGHAETLRGISSDYTLLHTHESFYYQKRDGRTGVVAEEVRPPAPMPPPPSSEPDPAWLRSIEQSSERVASLARALDGGPAVPAPAPEKLSVALELLRQERFSEALDAVDPILSRTPRDLDALLVKAVLLSHCGRMDRTEDVCRQILGADDLSAEAHYLLAICREQIGDSEGAIEQDRIAEYLDPAFAMPHLHVGRLARRKGDLSLARRQLAVGVELLGREEPSRILLFGGGFGREALAQMGRAELEACGGAP